MDNSRRLSQNKFALAALMKSTTVNHTAEAGRITPAEIHSLLAHEPLHKKLLSDLPGLVYIGRADQHRTLEHVSDGSRELLGLKQVTWPLALAPLIHPDDRDLVLQLIAAAVAELRSFALEYRLRHSGGEWLHVWEQGRAIRQGQRTVVQGYIMDVSQRRQREADRLNADQQFLQAQKNNALNKLAAGVAHEFNNLIAGILGSAEIVAMDLPEKHPAHESLKHIFEASNRARDFVHKLRALGQRRPLECKPFRLQPMIEDCVQILRSIIPAKVELLTQLAADCPKVHADQAQLHQAILDLCLQSWQGLTERRGCIKITLEKCPAGLPVLESPGWLRPGPHLRLTVRDNGPGLDKSARDKIFDPFQARRSGDKKMGLELFLVRETIQAHHGEIVVESEPGKGLAFHLYLPVVSEK